MKNKEFTTHAGCVKTENRQSAGLELNPALVKLEMLNKCSANLTSLQEYYNENLADFENSVISPEEIEIIQEAFFEKLMALEELNPLKEDVEQAYDVKDTAPFSYMGMKSLKEVELADDLVPGYGDGVKQVLPFSFTKSSLEKISVPDCCDFIGAYAFAGTHLKEIDLTPVNRTGLIVQQGAFMDCKYLKRVHGMHDLNIDSREFEGCISLAEIEVSDYVFRISNRAFKGCKSLTHFVFSESLLELDDEAFAGCTNLEMVRFLGKELESFGDGVFTGCPLKEVIVPEGYREFYEGILPSSLASVIVESNDNQ